MAKVILGMTTSLDGFVADRSGSVGRLYSDLAALMPVFFGAGRRFFDDPGLERVRLEKIGVQEVGERTSLSFRVSISS